MPSAKRAGTRDVAGPPSRLPAVHGDPPLAGAGPKSRENKGLTSFSDTALRQGSLVGTQDKDGANTVDSG